MIKMKKVAYYVDLNDEKLCDALLIIAETICCFMWEEEEGRAIVIQARNEDIPFVERTLAPFV